MQKRFCEEYLIDLNATHAAIRAGYSKKTAAAQAARLLRNVKVQNYKSELSSRLKSEKIADVTEVMEYLTSVMRGKSESEIIVVEGKGDGISSARHITKNPDEKERLKAAELIGKRFGMFDKKEDEQINEPVRIVDDI